MSTAQLRETQMEAHAFDEGVPDPLDLQEESDSPIGAKERFTIDSEDAANWYLRKLHQIDSEIALVQAQALEIVTRLQSRRAGLERQFQADLEHYARSRFTGKAKSLQLLYGTCAVRTVPASPHVENLAAALEWACDHAPDLVGLEATLDKKAYLALMKADGEALPGIVITPARESFSIKFATPKGES